MQYCVSVCERIRMCLRLPHTSASVLLRGGRLIVLYMKRKTAIALCTIVLLRCLSGDLPFAALTLTGNKNCFLPHIFSRLETAQPLTRRLAIL